MYHFEYSVYNLGLHSRTALSCWPKTTLDAFPSQYCLLDEVCGALEHVSRVGTPTTCLKTGAGPKEERRESKTTYLKTSNDPSFAISSGAKLLQPSRIVFVVLVLTSVLLRQSQSGQADNGHPITHPFPTSLVPPKIVVPLPGRGITYLFSFIVFAYFASPFTSTVCPLTGNIASSGTSSFAPNPLALTKMSPPCSS